MTGIVVIVAGAVGSVGRFLVARAIQRTADADVPIGTAVVNLAGALVLGLVVGADVDGLAGSGLAGLLAGFTTYSTWMVETVALAEEGSVGRSLIDLVGLVAAGLALALVGLMIGRAL